MRWGLVLSACCFFSCSSNGNSFPLLNKQYKTTPIYIQPFKGLPSSCALDVYSTPKNYYSNVVLLTSVPLPQQAWYEPRKRYRADSLIAWLKNRVQDEGVVIGLTSNDISTTKNEIKDWGVMGLAFTPGRSCVASTFRLNKEQLRQQFFKVVIHELGHTQGLSHCSVKTCFMRNADGGNPTNEEKDFCPACRKYLMKKGWVF